MATYSSDIENDPTHDNRESYAPPPIVAESEGEL